MYKLIIQDDEGKTTIVPLIRDEITIGRKEGNTIRLTERNVSRRHARIVKANGSILVEDLDSYNGVRVNGNRVQGRVAVSETDRIQIGDYLIELKLERGAQVDTIPPGGAPQRSELKTLTGVAQVSQPAMQAVPPPMPPPKNPAMRTAIVGPGDAAAMIQLDSVMPERPGRLVVLSGALSGREFRLERPAMVIGRTDDNDIVINHRSISRHHAKIVREQGRYAIVDMQSANGVKVNGEEYGKVELRRGDVVDLGHVRMRYVDADEQFVVPRDAGGHEEGASPKKGKGPLFAVLGVVLVGGVVGVILLNRGGDKTTVASRETTPSAAPAAKPPEVPAAVAPPVAPAPAPPAVAAAPPPPPAPPPAAPAIAAPPAPAGPDVKQLVADAQKAVSAQKWGEALAAGQQALKADPQNAEAKALTDKATAEIKNQGTYERFVEDLGAGRIAEAARGMKDLPENSVYRPMASQKLDEVRSSWVHQREVEARALASKGQCDEIGVVSRRVGDVFPDSRATIDKLATACKNTVVAARTPPTPQAPEGPPPPPPPPAPAKDPVALLADAKEAVRAGNYAEARKKADDVLKIKPGDQDALIVAANSACHLGDKDRAIKYISKLKGEKQAVMKRVCVQNGVVLDP